MEFFYNFLHCALKCITKLVPKKRYRNSVGKLLMLKTNWICFFLLEAETA